MGSPGPTHLGGSPASASSTDPLGKGGVSPVSQDPLQLRGPHPHLQGGSSRPPGHTPPRARPPPGPPAPLKRGLTPTTRPRPAQLIQGRTLPSLPRLRHASPAPPR